MIHDDTFTIFHTRSVSDHVENSGPDVYNSTARWKRGQKRMNKRELSCRKKRRSHAFTVFIQYRHRGQLFDCISFRILLASSNGQSVCPNILHETLYSRASFDSWIAFHCFELLNFVILFTRLGNVLHLLPIIVNILQLFTVSACLRFIICWRLTNFQSISSRPQCASSIGSTCEAKQWGRAG